MYIKFDFSSIWLFRITYSPDDAERFIDASDANKSPPTAELDEQSRNQLQRLRTDYEKLNQDFIC